MPALVSQLINLFEHAGGGTVVSLTGSGDNWTVVVAGPDGSLTQSVVSATLDRVTALRRQTLSVNH